MQPLNIKREHIIELLCACHDAAASVVNEGAQHPAMCMAFHAEQFRNGDVAFLPVTGQAFTFDSDKSKDKAVELMRRVLAKPDVDLMVFCCEAWSANVEKDADPYKVKADAGGAVKDIAGARECVVFTITTKMQEWVAVAPLVMNDAGKRVLDDPTLYEDGAAVGGSMSLLNE